MSKEKEFFRSMSFTTAGLFGGDGKDTAREDKFNRFAAGVLALVGAEAMMVLLRKNFQKDKLNRGAIALSCLCFAAISFASFYYIDDSIETEEYTASLIRGIVYALLTVLTVWQGIVKYRAAKEYSPYPRGQSQLLSFLKVNNDEILYYALEPSFVILLGLTYAFYDTWGGLPIIILGTTYWIRDILHLVFLRNNPQQKANQSSHNQNDDADSFSS